MYKIISCPVVYPVYVSVASLHLPLHVITETLGMFIGFRYFLFLRRRQGDQVDSNNRIWSVIGATFGALLGSRLLGALENPPGLLHAANPLLYIYQNKTIVGGLLGGLIGVETIKKLVGERQSTGDLFTYPLILAMIIGRIGCFSMGIYEETYGVPTALPWGMDLGDGLMRHPVALYEIVFLLTLWQLLRMVSRRYRLVSGARFQLFMIGYLLFRFLLDFIKPGYRFPFGLGAIQLACLAGLIYYTPVIIFPSRLIEKQYA
ncbi:prolipoprotein diacylglyceryl transferase [Chitinophaga varians]|uniref:Prolipoprotein diacylglyceryl transferase n=1 Tax=Chitinophaga varians TaxID=2202339 RepID=A0A847RR23_9BACT|nr:prolipoprotein diacylglyceryl transferase family protein [Chitinophaga varians]NLR65456.1 prolipoprotein diacylglyceryl transferase [Chitinophaga varians]